MQSTWVNDVPINLFVSASTTTTTQPPPPDLDLDPNEIWDTYKSECIVYGNPHPGDVVQGSALSSVAAPITHYPLPDSLAYQINEGKLSRLQLEGVAYACDKHRQFLADGSRAGFIVGDSAGIGKGRQMSGIILDNLMRGRKRHVWVSVSKDLHVDATRDLTDIGCGVQIIPSIAQLAGKVVSTECVLFCTYKELSTGKPRVSKKNPNPKTRYEELMEFLTFGCTQDSFDGVIVFDECHKAKNYVPGQDGEKGKGSTTTGDYVVQLQDELPKARVVYSSATGITSIINMAYMTRMGIWGPGLGYENFNEFKAAFGRKGTAMAKLELVAIDFKSKGAQVARNIGYKGAEFHRLDVPVSADDVRMYNALAGLLCTTLVTLRKAMELGAYIPGKIKIDKLGVEKEGESPDPLMLFWSMHQGFTRKLLTYMKVDGVVECALKEIKDGKCVVIGLQGTNESADKKSEAEENSKASTTTTTTTTNKRVKVVVEEEDEEYDENDEDRMEEVMGVDSKNPDGLVSACRATYKSYLATLFPVHDRNTRSVSAEFIKLRNDLMTIANETYMPPGALNYLIDRLGGVDRVAEMTGRTRRQVREGDTFVFRDRAREPSMANSINVQERNEFQEGRKLIGVISEAASTGVSLHAARTATNQRRRVHFTLELPWAADQAIQQLGRTHRTNQVSAPIYQLVSTGIGGENRFVSSVARRLQSLGALTQGDKNASVGSKTFGDFQFESMYGKAAVGILYKARVNRTVKRVEDGVETYVEIKTYNVDMSWKKAWEASMPHILLTPADCDTPEFPHITVSEDDAVNQRTFETTMRVAVDYFLGVRRGEHVYQTLQFDEKKEIDVTRFLNRMLGLPVAYQSLVFHYFSGLLEHAVAMAKMAGKYEKGVQAWTGCTITRAEEPEHLSTVDGGILTIHTFNCDRGVDLANAIREMKFAALLRNDATVKREDVPLCTDPRMLEAEWMDAYRMAKNGSEAKDVEYFNLSSSSYGRQMYIADGSSSTVSVNKKTNVCFIKSTSKVKNIKDRVALAIKIDDNWKIVRPSTGFLDAEMMSSYDVQSKFMCMFPGDTSLGHFKAIQSKWDEEYVASYDKDDAETGKRVFTSLLLTGSLMSCWGKLCAVQYIKGKDKVKKPIDISIVQTTVDGKRITGIKWPAHLRSVVHEIVGQHGSAGNLPPADPVSPVVREPYVS